MTRLCWNAHDNLRKLYQLSFLICSIKINIIIVIVLKSQEFDLRGISTIGMMYHSH